MPRNPKHQLWSHFSFVRCFSRSAFLVACVTRSNEIYPIGDQLISPPDIPRSPLPTPAGSPGNVAHPSCPPIWPLHRAFNFDESINPRLHLSDISHFFGSLPTPVTRNSFRPCLPCLYRNPLVKPLAFLHCPRQAP